MRRIGILSFTSPGHFYPLTALGRRLQSRGHEVVYFQVADLEAPIRDAGLEFHPIGVEDFPVGSIRKMDEEIGRLKGLAGFRCVIRRVDRNLKMILRDGPAAVREEGVDALIVDQAEVAGGTVADHLGIPFVSVAAALPINMDDSVPFFLFPWLHALGPAARLRNRLGNQLVKLLTSGAFRSINQQRRAWGLPEFPDTNVLYSSLAQITQLPEALELSGRKVPPQFHHTGPWTDDKARAPVDFPWSRLDPGRPLVYVSMGTLQNGVVRPYQIIAEAAEGLGLQLVISLGGGMDPSALGDIPGDPIVVKFAPQLELIRRASLTISHGGLNTVLESLASGVPMVVLPVTNDQPGVGARVEWSGVGRSIPIGRLTVDRLRSALHEVLDDPTYRERAEALRSSIEALDGLNRAADLVEAAFDRTGSPFEGMGQSK